MRTINQDVLSQLPRLAFGDLDAPEYTEMKVSWKNALAERLIPYVPGAVHDDMGRHPFKLTADLLFYNGLSTTNPAGLVNFPDYFNQWMPMLVTGEVRTLRHPVLGDVRARVEDVNFEIKAGVRSGTKVNVTWTDTVEDPADLNLLGFTNTALPTAQLASLADSASAPFGVVYDQGRQLFATATQFGIPVTNLTISIAVLDVFLAVIPSLTLGSLVSLSLLSAFQGGIARMVDQLNALNNPATYAATDALITFWIALDNKRRQLASNARKTAIYVTGNKMTIDSVARATGNTILEIVQLNLKLLFSPGIPKATNVTYYMVG